MDLTLASDEMQSVRRILTRLLAQSEADECFLCDSAGNVIAREGTGPQDAFLVSALAAGVFGASKELARLLGEEEFGSVLHQGKKTSIFFQAASEDLLLLTVFSETASIGLVKLYAAGAAGDLRQTLAGAGGPGHGARLSLGPLILNDEDDVFVGNTGQVRQAN